MSSLSSPSSKESTTSLTRLTQEAMNVQLAKETALKKHDDDENSNNDKEKGIFLKIFRSLHQTMGDNLFEKVVKQVENQMIYNCPRFPQGIVVSDIPRRDQEMEHYYQDVPPSEMDTTMAATISPQQSNISDNGSDTTSDIIPTNGFAPSSQEEAHRDSVIRAISTGRIGIQEVRDIQFHRWNWCCENIDTYVNMLRESEHSDESISNMIHAGQPLCIPNGSLFREFKESLRELQSCLEMDTGWTNISFILAGSSVCGFSQSFPPLLPDGVWYGCYSTTGIDVASHLSSGGFNGALIVCVQADGVKHFMDDFMTCVDSQLIGSYPTTCTPCMGGLRYRFLQEDGYSLVSNYLSIWYKNWSSKLGDVGLEITFGEDLLITPPWEIRFNLHTSDASTATTTFDGEIVSPSTLSSSSSKRPRMATDSSRQTNDNVDKNSSSANNDMYSKSSGTDEDSEMWA